MKAFHLCLAVCLCVVPFVQAQEAVEGPYEQQLRTYSEFHGDFTKQLEEENQKKREIADHLKLTGMKLKEEHETLQIDIETKEASVEKLKEVNQKLQAAQVIMHDQYAELEALFKDQKAENDRLKKELEISKTVFYQKMIEFYQQEEDVLSRQVLELQDRQANIRAMIQEMQKILEDQQ